MDLAQLGCRLGETGFGPGIGPSMAWRQPQPRPAWLGACPRSPRTPRRGPGRRADSLRHLLTCCTLRKLFGRRARAHWSPSRALGQLDSRRAGATQVAACGCALGPASWALGEARSLLCLKQPERDCVLTPNSHNKLAEFAPEADV